MWGWGHRRRHDASQLQTRLALSQKHRKCSDNRRVTLPLIEGADSLKFLGKKPDARDALCADPAELHSQWRRPVLLHDTREVIQAAFPATWIERLDAIADDILYEYKYDLNGKLVQKLIYYNYSTEPDYITKYLYDGKNLISSQLLAGDGITKLMQTDLTYDVNTTIKPWLYLYGDAFESYRFIQGFSFGPRSTLAVKKIVSTIYDANYGNALDTWTTNFSGYVISKDQHVLQVTCDGDLQQGMGLFLGTIRFDYQCN